MFDKGLEAFVDYLAWLAPYYVSVHFYLAVSSCCASHTLVFYASPISIAISQFMRLVLVWKASALG